jgi:hypothetical protein
LLKIKTADLAICRINSRGNPDGLEQAPAHRSDRAYKARAQKHQCSRLRHWGTENIVDVADVIRSESASVLSRECDGGCRQETLGEELHMHISIGIEIPIELVADAAIRIQDVPNTGINTRCKQRNVDKVAIGALKEVANTGTSSEVADAR